MFKDNLRFLRESKGLKQISLASELGISTNKISNWENGVTEPSIDSIIMLAKYFNVSTDYLLGYEEEATNILKENKDKYIKIEKFMTKQHVDFDDLIIATQIAKSFRDFDKNKAKISNYFFNEHVEEKK